MDAKLQRVEVEAVIGGDDHLAVDDATVGQSVPEWIQQFGEVALERECVSAGHMHLLTVAEDDRPESVPLRLVEPAAIARDLRSGAGEHRLEWRVEGERHAGSVADQAVLRLC